MTIKFWKLILPCLAFILVACGGGGSPDVVMPPPPTNNAPTVSTMNSDQVARVGTSFSYDATQGGTTFSDSDGDSLTYSISFNPNANGLSSESGTVTGTPNQAGTIMVSVTASDSNGGEISDIFQIVIHPGPFSTKPNIVLLISDDQGQDSSAEYNLSMDPPNTPNLSSLASSGIIFENAWVSPSCSPTRAALITGKYSSRTNVFAPADALSTDEVTLQSYLSGHGSTNDYSSAIIGKWHLGGGQSGPNNFGVDYFAGITTGGVGDYFEWNLNINGTTRISRNYVTSELTDLAIQWVNGQTGPWFLWLSYNAPHTPFHLPPNTLHGRTLTGTDEDISANPRPYYLAAIEAMDSEFGRFWNSLSVDTQANTIVIYLGDNGSPARVIDRTAYPIGNKGTLHEAGINTPMFVSGAGVTRSGHREAALINHTDFFPTIVEIAGRNQPSHHDGQSFIGLLSNSSTPSRDYIYSESADGWTIRNSRYKLIESTGGSRNLYDLQDDPNELTNLLQSAVDVTTIISELDAAAADIRR